MLCLVVSFENNQVLYYYYIWKSSLFIYLLIYMKIEFWLWILFLVHEVEYAFGAHDHSTTGIFEVDPKKSPGFTFRKSILIGRTDLGHLEVRAFMEKLAQDYCGNTYHLITKNCNHFCNDMCLKLTGKPVPRWVNRLARLGKPFQNFVLNPHNNIPYRK